MKEFFEKKAKKVVKWLDPKLENYRARSKKISHTEQENRRVAAKMSSEGILAPAEDGGAGRGMGDEGGRIDGAGHGENERSDKGNGKRGGFWRSKNDADLDADFEPTEEFPRPPRTEAELILMLRRTPKTVLSDEERQRIVAAMSFRMEPIRGLILPRSRITFVQDSDMMGPLMLDKLYQSGFSHFPVLDKNEQVVGILHTSALNSLEIKDTTVAGELMDRAVYYLRDDYTVEQALAAVFRTNNFFFLVVNKNGNLRGLITCRMLMRYVLGEVREEDFDLDRNLGAVLRRKL